MAAKGRCFDPPLCEEIKAVRDKMKEAAQKARHSAPGEEKLVMLHLETCPSLARRGLSMLCEEVDKLYSAAKEKANLRDYNDLEHFAYRALKDESRKGGEPPLPPYFCGRTSVYFCRKPYLAKFTKGTPVYGRRREAVHLPLPKRRPNAVHPKSERFKEDESAGELVHRQELPLLPNILPAVNEVLKAPCARTRPEDYLDEDKLTPARNIRASSRRWNCARLRMRALKKLKTPI